MDDLAPNDWRRGNPRFQGDNFAKNLAVVEQLNNLAQEKGCPRAQLTLPGFSGGTTTWIPIPGTSSRERLEENTLAMRVLDSRRHRDHRAGIATEAGHREAL
jgi:aryl-alcohol dehydrogenase-like predicted oxidoreductase